MLCNLKGDSTKIEKALSSKLNNSYHANRKLMASLDAQRSKEYQLRVRDGGLLGAGYSETELGEVERQVREQEAVLQGAGGGRGGVL